MTAVAVGDKGVDFLYGQPSPLAFSLNQIRFAALYLKRWDVDYVTQLHAARIGVLPIVETKATMMLDGAQAGHDRATKAVVDCRRFGVPEGTTIIFAHDTSTMNSSVVDFNVAAHEVVRSLRYGYGGYGGKKYFDDCIKAGVQFDLIWATNATAWLGGRHPDAHCWQGHYAVDGSDKGMYDTLDGIAVDKNVCRRPFSAWGPDAFSPPTEGDDMQLFVKAVDSTDGAIWELDEGGKTHVGGPYFDMWQAAEAAKPGSMLLLVRPLGDILAIPDRPSAGGAPGVYEGSIAAVPGRVTLTPKVV